MGRLAGLDAVRAAMMLLGIVVHSAIPFASGGTSAGYWVAPEQSLSVTVVLLVIHHWRMPVFFFLAGFVAWRLTGTRGVEAFLRNRGRRILGPWLASLVLLTPVMGLVADWNGSAARHPAPFHLWFLEYLLLFSMVLAAIRHWASEGLEAAARWCWSRSRWWVVAAPTAAALVLFPYAVVPYPAEFLPWWQVVVTHGWFYAAGAMFQAARPVLPWRALLAVVPAATAANLWLTRRAVEAGDVPDWLLAMSASAVIWTTLGALIGWASGWRSSAPRLVQELSRASYWIYLVHFPLALALPRVLSLWMPGIALPLLGTVLLTLLLAWGLWPPLWRQLFPSSRADRPQPVDNG